MGRHLQLKADRVRLELRGFRGLITLVGVTLLVVAIFRELRMPRERRTWHGMLVGLVPYDLRPPTVDRLVQTFWDPEQRTVLVPTAFGVGWSVNTAALIRVLRVRPGQTSP